MQMRGDNIERLPGLPPLPEERGNRLGIIKQAGNNRQERDAGKDGAQQGAVATKARSLYSESDRRNATGKELEIVGKEAKGENKS